MGTEYDSLVHRIILTDGSRLETSPANHSIILILCPDDMFSAFVGNWGAIQYMPGQRVMLKFTGNLNLLPPELRAPVEALMPLWKEAAIYDGAITEMRQRIHGDGTA